MNTKNPDIELPSTLGVYFSPDASFSNAHPDTHELIIKYSPNHGIRDIIAEHREHIAQSGFFSMVIEDPKHRGNYYTLRFQIEQIWSHFYRVFMRAIPGTWQLTKQKDEDKSSQSNS